MIALAAFLALWAVIATAIACCKTCSCERADAAEAQLVKLKAALKDAQSTVKLWELRVNEREARVSELEKQLADIKKLVS